METKPKFGRPRIIDTVEDLEKGLEEYFKGCGKKAPTTAGLAFSLGYAERQSLYDLKQRGEDFSYLIKRALLYIHAYHEGNLSNDGRPTGSIFWLKNHGWTDKTEIKHSGDKDEPVTVKLVSIADIMKNEAGS